MFPNNSILPIARFHDFFPWQIFLKTMNKNCTDKPIKEGSMEGSETAAMQT